MIKTAWRRSFGYAIDCILDHLPKGHLSGDVMGLLQTISINQLFDNLCIHHAPSIPSHHPFFNWHDLFKLPYKLAVTLSSLVNMNYLSPYHC